MVFGSRSEISLFSNPEAQWDGGDLSIIFDRCGFFKYWTIPLIQRRGKMKHLNEYLSISEQEFYTEC